MIIGAIERKTNDQLTDGGPPPAPELPSGSVGPPFGEALGSASRAA
jgi:hypothetical protein